MTLSVLLSSFTVDPVSFFIIFTVGIGMGKGLTLPASMKAGWMYLPHRKGLVSGIIMSSLSLGSVIYGIICGWAVNPNNTKNLLNYCEYHKI